MSAIYRKNGPRISGISTADARDITLPNAIATGRNWVYRKCKHTPIGYSGFTLDPWQFHRHHFASRTHRDQKRSNDYEKVGDGKVANENKIISLVIIKKIIRHFRPSSRSRDFCAAKNAIAVSTTTIISH